MESFYVQKGLARDFRFHLSPFFFYILTSEHVQSSRLSKVEKATIVKLVRRLCGGGQEEILALQLDSHTQMTDQQPLDIGDFLSALQALNAAASAKDFRDFHVILKYGRRRTDTRAVPCQAALKSEDENHKRRLTKLQTS